MKLLKYGLCAALLLNSMLVLAEPKDNKARQGRELAQKTNKPKKKSVSTKHLALEVAKILAGIGAVLGIGYGLSRWYNAYQTKAEIKKQSDYLAQISEKDHLLQNDKAYLNMLDKILNNTTLSQEQKVRLTQLLNEVCQGFNGAYNRFTDYSKQEFEVVAVKEVVTINDETLDKLQLTLPDLSEQA